MASRRPATGELIDYRLVRTESQSTWEVFLTNLACRGLLGALLALITTDGHRGLHAALDLVYPAVPRQACWVHVLRNVAQRVRVRDRERCLAQARRIYEAPTRPAAERLLQAWVRAWQPVERAFREVRRRTRPMTCFTNDASCERIIYAVMHYLNSQWAGRPLGRESTQNS